MYKEFINDVEKATNEINQKQSINTTRHGAAGLRDKFAFYKMSLFFAYGYISIVQTMIVFLGLTPQAIDNLNMFLLLVGIKYQFPVNISSVVAIGLVVGLFIFGVLAMMYLGLYKREAEVSTRQNPGFYLVDKQNREIIKILKEMRDD